MRRGLTGWSSTERRERDGSITSEQSVRLLAPLVDPSEDGARSLGRRYWRELSRASGGLVGCREGAGGVELRLLGRGPRLLLFGPAEVSVSRDLVECRYPIRGGLLTRHAGGALTFSQEGGDEPALRMAVSGFFPHAVYRLVQRAVHIAISRRYLAGLISQEPS